MDWLLEGDPAIRWQVLRDLVQAPLDEVEAERARVETQGWGARLLAARDLDGQWGGGACFPRRIVDDWQAGIEPDFSDGQPWTSTLPTLMLLHDLGLDPGSAAARETIRLVTVNCRWEHDGQAFFDGEVEACINGRTLSIGAYFGADVGSLVTGLLADQLDDGGWNCWTENGAIVSSFDSTICVLEGLREYEESAGNVSVRDARRRGEEYLLERQLFRRRSTGEVPAERWLQFSWPPRWHYDVLRAWTTSAAPPMSRIRGLPRRCSLSVANAKSTAPGCSRTPTQGRPSSTSRTATDGRAGGTLCGRCGSSTGTTAGGSHATSSTESPPTVQIIWPRWLVFFGVWRSPVLLIFPGECSYGAGTSWQR